MRNAEWRTANAELEKESRDFGIRHSAFGIRTSECALRIETQLFDARSVRELGRPAFVGVL